MSQSSQSWFGPAPWGRLCQWCPREVTPVGKECIHCREPIGKEDSGVIIPALRVPPRPAWWAFWRRHWAAFHLLRRWPVIREIDSVVHRECFLRGIFGSLGHQRRRCPCYGGTEDDPPGLTTREAAVAAVAFFEWTNTVVQEESCHET